MAFEITLNTSVRPPLIQMSGVLDETVNLNGVSIPKTEEVAVCAKGVSRLNSAGIRVWLAFFQRLRDQGIRLRFRNVSSAIVDLNDVVRLVRPAEVESVMFSVLCSACGKRWLLCLRLMEWEADLKRLKACACAKCGGRLAAEWSSSYRSLIDALEKPQADTEERIDWDEVEETITLIAAEPTQIKVQEIKPVPLAGIAPWQPDFRARKRVK